MVDFSTDKNEMKPIDDSTKADYPAKTLDGSETKRTPKWGACFGGTMNGCRCGFS